MDGRKRWSAKEKLQILKECQESGATVSEVCRRHALNTAQYYQWLKQSEAATLESFQNGKQDINLIFSAHPPNIPHIVINFNKFPCKEPGKNKNKNMGNIGRYVLMLHDF